MVAIFEGYVLFFPYWIYFYQNVMFESLRRRDAPQKNRIYGVSYPLVFKLSKEGIEVAVAHGIHFSPDLPVGCTTQGYQKLVGLSLKVISKQPEKEN